MLSTLNIIILLIIEKRKQSFFKLNSNSHTYNIMLSLLGYKIVGNFQYNNFLNIIYSYNFV